MKQAVSFRYLTGLPVPDSNLRKKGGNGIYTTVSAEYIKKALGEYEKRLACINERMVELYRVGKDAEGLIRSLSFQGKEDGHMLKDLSSLLLRHKALMAEREQEIRVEMWRLAEEEETLKRVWICYRALEDVQFQIVRCLYVDKNLYAAAEKEFDMSHGKFEKERAAAINRILKLYHSNLTNLQILSQDIEVKCSSVT